MRRCRVVVGERGAIGVGGPLRRSELMRRRARARGVGRRVGPCRVQADCARPQCAPERLTRRDWPWGRSQPQPRLLPVGRILPPPPSLFLSLPPPLHPYLASSPVWALTSPRLLPRLASSPAPTPLRLPARAPPHCPHPLDLPLSLLPLLAPSTHHAVRLLLPRTPRTKYTADLVRRPAPPRPALPRRLSPHPASHSTQPPSTRPDTAPPSPSLSLFRPMPPPQVLWSDWCCQRGQRRRPGW